eukprot:2604133-Rhodomonas_salina.1
MIYALEKEREKYGQQASGAPFPPTSPQSCRTHASFSRNPASLPEIMPEATSPRYGAAPNPLRVDQHRERALTEG